MEVGSIRHDDSIRVDSIADDAILKAVEALAQALVMALRSCSCFDHQNCSSLITISAVVALFDWMMHFVSLSEE